MAKKSVVKGGVIGVLIGAIGGILFAPKSGKETRKDIKEAAHKANSEAEAKLKQLHGELMEKVAEAKQMAAEYTGKAKDEIEDLQKRAEFTKQQVSELISSVREFEADDSEVDKALSEGKSLVEKITKAKKPAKKPASKKK